MTTNIRYGWTDDYRFEPQKHLQWLQRHPADIIGYQEVNKGSIYGSFMDLYQYYRSSISGNSVYGDASYGFGNSLSTSLNIKDSRVFAYRSADMIQRSFVWTLLEFNDLEIEVYVTHLSHLPNPNKIRQEQVAELIDWIGRSKRPWILMGDFNAQPDEPEIVELLKMSNQVFTQKPELLKELSHDSLEPTMRIDYIFFSEHFELIEQKVLDNQGTSDHRPVLARLKLNKTVLARNTRWL
jgi:endonuclease/exonuclease/phosphatase family metal-dependent hydrolase